MIWLKILYIFLLLFWHKGCAIWYRGGGVIRGEITPFIWGGIKFTPGLGRKKFTPWFGEEKVHPWFGEEKFHTWFGEEKVHPLVWGGGRKVHPWFGGEKKFIPTSVELYAYFQNKKGKRSPNDEQITIRTPPLPWIVDL